ncbi:MAG: terminase large subunit domain-containing protein [Pseudomonadota bacterium]
MKLLAPEEQNADRIASEELLARLPKGDLLLGYQQRTIDRLFAGTALLVIEKSRRIGLTWGLASYLVLRAAAQKSAGGQSGWYMGYDKEMTLEFIEVCAMWARAFGIAGAETGEDVLEYEDEDGKSQSIQVYRIRFASGFKITALASVPRALRGKQGIVVIDEAAFHKNVDEVIKAAIALLIWGGQVIIVSTHDGIGNRFNTLIDEIRSKRRAGAVMTITFADAMADGLYDRVAAVAAVKGMTLPPPDIWEAEIRATYGDDAAEELDCIPKVGSGSLISIEDIIACEHDDCRIPELYGGGLYYLGRDVARRRDGAIQVGMELVGDVLWERDQYREYGTSFAHQDAWFDARFLDRRIVQAGVDQTGMGEKVVEDAQIRHGMTRVRGMLLTGPNRLEISLSLKRRFQERRIRIAKDPRTRTDLMAIKKMGSEESGTIRIVNDGELHADEFWAYGLASIVADLPPALYEHHRVPKGWRDTSSRHPEDRERMGRGGRFGRGAY